MKKMRKLLAVLMTLAMVMGLGMTSFAADSNYKTTITVNEVAVTDSTSVQYYQAVLASDTAPTGWVFANETVAGYFKSAFGVSTDADAIAALIALGKLDVAPKHAYEGEINTDTATVNGKTYTASQFATAIENIKDNEELSDEKVTSNGETYTIADATAGLYVIKATGTDYTYITMAAYVGYSYSNSGEVDGLIPAVVKAKGSSNGITKDLVEDENTTDSDKSVTVGDIVNYSATTYYPFYDADTPVKDKVFTVTDTVTNATYVANSLEVYVGTTELTEESDYTVTQYAGEKTFTVTFIYDEAHAGKTVTLNYSIEIGNEKIDVTNNIKSTFDQTGDTVTIDTVAVEITKVDATTTTTLLDGAKFEIYEALTSAEGATQTVENAMVNDVVTDKTLFLKKVDEGTTVAGKVKFVGLDATKKYYIKETVAPEGYSLNNSYYEVTGSVETTKDNSKTYTFTDFTGIQVKDTKLNALPSTGGIGTTIFTIGGCVIMVAAAYMYFVSRRREEEQ